MRRPVWIGLLAFVLMPACGGGGDEGSSPPSSAKPSQADECRVGPPAPGERRHPGPPYHAGTLTGVTVGHHGRGTDRYDRVTLTFACQVPEFRLEEPRRIEVCCKPKVVEIRGRHLVKLVFRGAQAHDLDTDRWTSTVGRRPADVDLPVLRSHVLAEDWEGVVSVGLGLSRPARCWSTVRQTSGSEAVLTVHFQGVSKRELATIEARERRTACV